MKSSKKFSLKTAVMAFAFVCFGITFSNAQSMGKREQQEPPTYAKLIEQFDANEDGKLAEDELKGPLKEQFSEIDTDEDGFISEEEFKNAPKPERGGRRSRN
ncbi:hypothetical protein SCB49_11112 [unidentified eubacterium SCB49]|nr:hypothetical protein SCB49_11112 [unidentified eubacterium SCB49]